MCSITLDLSVDTVGRTRSRYTARRRLRKQQRRGSHELVDSDNMWVRGWQERISNKKKIPSRIVLKPDAAIVILDARIDAEDESDGVWTCLGS